MLEPQISINTLLEVKLPVCPSAWHNLLRAGSFTFTINLLHLENALFSECGRKEVFAPVCRFGLAQGLDKS